MKETDENNTTQKKKIVKDQEPRGGRGVLGRGAFTHETQIEDDRNIATKNKIKAQKLIYEWVPI